jgi:tRNA A-37 threonylcarbamoyl transferase component Bud32
VTPERWQEIKKVLADAMELPVSDREAFIQRASANDDELRREVLSLLAVADSSGELINTGRLAVDGDRALHAILATALGQQYEIVRPLGQGGMGAVYLARERALERFVAIKVLRPDLADAAGSRERFRREARVAAQLSHPGILPLHTFGEVSGIWYFVMGYVRGVSLAERLRLEGRLPSDEAQRILAELADALETAHRHGVIHRDIKPANILLDDESGRAMLADFGIAKVHGAGDSLTGTGVIIGTPHYMSPEQSLGASTLDERSDIYSLGAVAYTMLAGREPFTGSTVNEVHIRRLSQDAPALTAIAPSVPLDLAAIVMRCLAREPGDRWQNARGLRDALARARGDSLATIPESLRDLPAFGPYALLWAAALTALAIRSDRPAGDRVLLMLIALLVPFGFILHMWSVGRPDLGWGGIARVAFWPPDWWGMWWPRALRRPTDLWRRLPWEARAVRVSISMFLIILPSMILLREEIQAAAGAQATDEWFDFVQSALVVGVAVATVAGLFWAYVHRLSWPDTARLLFGATVPSPGWSSPGISKLLRAADGRSRPPGHDTPSDYRRAIVELLAALPNVQSERRSLITATTNRLYAEIESCDAEIHALNRDASPAEVERLTERLATLDLEAQHGSPLQELRSLVRRQLDLIREMRVGAEVISQGRAHLYALMRGLWAQLCVVRDNAGDNASLIERVIRLCEEIQAELTATQSEANSRLSQARAVAHSRFTVAGEIFNASAVSSMVRPAK